MADDGDSRDEWLAERLRVPPLDEVTRRRLVGAALRATDPTRSRGPDRSRLPAVAAAAAAAVVLAGGLMFLAVRGDGTTPTASRPAGQPAGQEKRPQSATLPPGAVANSGPATLGDLGDLRAAAARERLRAAVDTTRGRGAAHAQTTDGGGETGFASGLGADELVQDLADAGCGDALPGGTLVAVGTGRLGSRDAVVVVLEDSAGGRAAYAVDLEACAVRVLH